MKYKQLLDQANKDIAHNRSYVSTADFVVNIKLYSVDVNCITLHVQVF
jgi:hypothetical protein